MQQTSPALVLHWNPLLQVLGHRSCGRQMLLE
jgi:hypothetical protein